MEESRYNQATTLCRSKRDRSQAIASHTMKLRNGRKERALSAAAVLVAAFAWRPFTPFRLKFRADFPPLVARQLNVTSCNTSWDRIGGSFPTNSISSLQKLR